ncbi:MAG: aminopeptidase, partial [Nonlabens sp.]
MKNTFFLFLATLFIITSCQENKQSIEVIKEAKTYLEESHSYAQPNDAVTTHLDLDINVDFDTQIISGTATYDVINNGSNQIILDSKFLEIESVTANGVA